MLISTVHMLLYKTNAHRCIGLWSLQVCILFAQSVSVAIVKARRVYFIHTGVDRHMMHVLRLPQEDVVAIFINPKMQN